MKKYLTLLITLCSIQLFGQNEISLQQLIDSTKHYYRIDLDVSMSYANKALKFCDTADYDNLGECLKNKGVVYYYLYKTDSASVFYHKALDIFKAANNIKGVQATVNNLAILHLVQGQTHEAISYYDKSYELALQINDNQAILRAISNISNLYIELRDYPKSLEILLKGKPYIGKCTDSILMTAYYANLYSSYRYNNDYENWEKYISIVHKIVLQTRDSSKIVPLLTNIASGNLHFKINWAKKNGLDPNKRSSYKKLMDSIIKLDLEALNYFQSKKMRLQEVHLYENLGSAFYFIEKYKLSNEYLQMGLKLADSLKMNQYLINLYEILADNAFMTSEIVKQEEYLIKKRKLETLITKHLKKNAK